MLLIIESGSSKSDAIIKQKSKNIKFSFEGINPAIFKKDDIFEIINKQDKLIENKEEIESIYFYGAGCSSIIEKKKIEEIFISLFPKIKKITIESDIFASALSCYEDNAIISCILGTGSNSCYFDGKKIFEKTPSLGYILGDEGSATHLGKKLLIEYFYKKLPKNIEEKLKKEFDLNKDTLIEKLYKSEKANIFLSSFTPFIYENKEYEAIRLIIEKSFDDFIYSHILPYKNCKDVPICFVGSISFYFREILEERLKLKSLHLGKIIQKPIDILSNKIL